MDPFLADFLRLLEEKHADFVAALEGLPSGAINWQPGEGMNSLGVLAFHTAGAERFWIGDIAMQEPLKRDRPGEFAARDVNAQQAIARLGWSLDYAREALERLTVADLAMTRVNPRNGGETTAGWAILHALEHTAMHAGHAQMTRQLWEVRASS
ncbi:MAG: DinB family protein [Anaerolineae bacterium]|nr:DinB family protein [Anaerolineae bacterium]